uniref:MIP02679p n=1 Tax=Drosophila melanogaster TaxID=7227 RepID=B8A400_DROME|nr:MIP02679p [Drosophila melanogaster]
MLAVTGGIPKTLGGSVGSGLVIHGNRVMGGSCCWPSSSSVTMWASIKSSLDWHANCQLLPTARYICIFLLPQLNGVPEGNSKCHNNQLAIKWRPSSKHLHLATPPNCPMPMAMVIQNLLNDVRLPITN